MLWVLICDIREVRDLVITYSQIYGTDMSSQHSVIIWTFWLKGWMFVYELNGGYEIGSRCCLLNFRYCPCFVQGVSWHSGNYRVKIHSETRTWYENNLQSNAPYRKVLTTQLNHFARWAKYSSVCLETKWLWVRIPLLPLKLYILRLVWTRRSLIFRQL